MQKLKPCPFCDGDAEFERIGTSRVSCCVACTDCGCRLETGEVGDMCGTAWNTRSNQHIKSTLLRVGEKINSDMRIAKNAKRFAMAILLNELSDIEKTNSHENDRN